MAAVTEDQYTEKKGGMSSLIDVPALAAKIFYHLTLGFIDAANGFATDVINAGANKFAGIVAQNQIDNSAGGNGDKIVELEQCGAWLLTGSGFTQADVGKKAYAIDNYTVTTTSTNNTYIGTITKFESATQVWVQIDTQLP